MSQTELAWAAGFFDGEGNSRATGATIQLSAVQTSLEPLERLQRALGGRGRIVPRSIPNAKPHWLPQWIWKCWTREDTAAAIEAMWPYLCSIKRMQFRRAQALCSMNHSFWRRGYHPNHGRARRAITQCPQGHPYDDTNTLRYPNSSGGISRSCRECRNRRSSAYGRRKRAERRVAP
jgi:hypothetical protein